MLVENVVGDMEALPFEDGSFDAALFVGALHHVPDPLPALREASRVVRPGGRLFAAEPCSLRVGKAGVAPVPGHAHEFRFSLPFLTGRMREAGVRRRRRRRESAPRSGSPAPCCAGRRSARSAAPTGSTGRSPPSRATRASPSSRSSVPRVDVQSLTLSI